MIPTNIAPLVDLSIRNTGRPVTRQPMTQDMRNDILNSKTDRLVIRQPMTQDYLNHGDPTSPYESCGALLWHAEDTLESTTEALVTHSYYQYVCGRCASFIDNIRRYNSMFAFTSIGGKVDDTVNYGRGPFCYRIHGENYHRVCSLFPGTGDFDNTKNKRDIILLQQDGDLKRISKLHPQYLAMQYPLFSHTPRTDTVQIYSIMALQTMMKKNKGTRVTMKEWFSYRVQERENEFSMMLNGRRLFQQFPVDGYIMIEAERMSFNRKQQKDLRSETYSKLAKLAEDPESGVQLCGKKVVLSSSFTGSPRQYQSHKNVEWCNQIGSIKYLFKYINKGPDRVTAAVDGAEIEQSVIFDATESIDYTLEKSSVNETKFVHWMELNKTDDFASTLLYAEIPKYYVWNTHKRIWDQRQRDEKEYIDGLLEASQCGMGDYLRSFFVMLLMTDSMSRPEFIWEKTWHVMAAYVENVERIKQNKPGGMFFVYGYGGTGKTYLYKTKSVGLRSQGDIVLNVASIGIATLLLEGGRTAHS
ncbi:putative PIF1 DNA helicase/replication protein A1-like protein [Tanacetum coccineum]